MINRIPLELEPPEPMQPPPLLKRPFITPHFNNASIIVRTASAASFFD